MIDPTPPQVTPPATPPTDPPKDEKVTPSTPPVTPPEQPSTPPEENNEPEVDKTEEKKDIEIDKDLDMLDPENVKKVVNKTVEERLSSVRQSLTEQRITNDINSELAAHPEYKPYEKRIKAWVNHPNRKGFIEKGFPVRSVILEAIAPYLEKIGAEKAKNANDKANKTKVDGQPVTVTPPTKVDVNKMSNADIDKLAQDVKNGFVKNL